MMRRHLQWSSMLSQHLFPTLGPSSRILNLRPAALLPPSFHDAQRCFPFAPPFDADSRFDPPVTPRLSVFGRSRARHVSSSHPRLQEHATPVHHLLCPLQQPIPTRDASLRFPQTCGASPAPASFTAEFHTTAGSFTVQSQVPPATGLARPWLQLRQGMRRCLQSQSTAH